MFAATSNLRRLLLALALAFCLVPLTAFAESELQEPQSDASTPQASQQEVKSDASVAQPATQEEGVDGAAAPAEASSLSYQSFTYVNPLYKDLDIAKPADSSDAQSDRRPAKRLLGSVPVYDRDQAIEELKDAMVRRVATLKFSIVVADGDCQSFFSGLYAAAIAEDGNPKHGDGLRWAVKEYGAGYSWNPSDPAYPVTYEVSFTYHSTAEQEEAVDRAVDEFVSGLDLDSMSDLQKIRAAYDRLMTVNYDHDSSDGCHSAYAALVKGSAVCQGYAAALYRLCGAMGVSCRMISGIGDNGSGTRERHAWNIVKIGYEYYNVDATWDAGWRQEGRKFEYYLKCSNDFTDHTRDTDYTTAEFNDLYPMSSVNYADRDNPDDVYALLYANGTMVMQKGKTPDASQGDVAKSYKVDLDVGAALAPWDSDCLAIKEVIVKDSIAPLNIAYWFKGCENLTSADLSKVDTSKVTDMSYLFCGCYALSSLDLSAWDTAQVENMKYLFFNCISLSKICVGELFSTAAVVDSERMFTSCWSLVGGKGTKYDNNYVDGTRARVDGGPNVPGYFTAKLSLSLNKDKMTLGIGEEFQLEAAVVPDSGSGRTFSWKSSDPDIAAVASDGTVTGKGVGSATVIASVEFGGETFEVGCEVAVTCAKLYANSLNLDDSISINYYLTLTLPEGVSEDKVALRCWPKGNESAYQDLRSEESRAAGGKEYRFFSFAGINAKMMGDVICSQSVLDKDGDGVFETSMGFVSEYSVETYAKNQLGKSQDDKLKALLVSLLNYGAAAQMEFGYKTDRLANASLDESQKTVPQVSLSSLESHKCRSERPEGVEPTVKLYACSLDLKENVHLKYYFEPAEGSSMTVEDMQSLFFVYGDEKKSTLRYDSEKNLCYADIEVKAPQLSNLYSVWVEDADEKQVSDTTFYGPLSYVYNKLSSESETSTLYALCQSVADYAAKADGYFNGKEG